MTLSPLEESLLHTHFSTPQAYAQALERLEAGEPFAYVIGEWYFWDETYFLNADCLIPRPDTEHLVEWLIAHTPKGGRVLDLCTGSGCIAISTLAHRPDLTADGIDIAPGALEMARKNAAYNRVADRFRVWEGNVLSGPDAAAPLGLYDIIVSNPPYIHTAVIDTLSPQVRHEPRRALDGGEDGMDFYAAILRHYPPHLKPGGKWLFEIGYDQASAIRALAAAHSLTCEIRKDYGGNDRMAILASPPAAKER